jgi:hypothetical protein
VLVYINLGQQTAKGSKALLPIISQIRAFGEMTAEWAESGKEEPPKIVWQYIHCLDPSLENGEF